jgi:hypothetical protein
VEVLEDHDHRLGLRFTEQQPFVGVERSVTPLGRIEGLPLRIVHRHFEEAEEGRQERLQRLVKGEKLARDLLPECAMIVAILELAVSPQEILDGQVADRLAVGDGAGLEDEPALV